MTKLMEVKSNERINLEKEEEIKIITGNFKELEKKKEIDTSLSNKKVKDISGQTKNNNFSSKRCKNRKNSDTQNHQNGKINEMAGN
ncbi:hypothetical protein RhiirA4_484111 [Rhizophagus irregularis]|uniref:Uncharacterized protein n=1 Tax=Rhizophagus irregularis TaxID=588596 RepID=A0A2I1HNG0_9GLOM|nr:hypothetical protein RhiirA4_484111 [Rhizophagus irregularis]